MRFALAFAVSSLVAGLATGASSVAASTNGVPVFAGADTLDGSVLRLALNAVACARTTAGVTKDLLTVIDYSKASTEPRLWVLDLLHERVLFAERVAHGRGSGDNYATRFSNDDGSHQTSLGLFKTADTYVGNNGYSLRLDGLEAGVNDRARERAIVFHGAPYVSNVSVQSLGRLGRSWGCPALRPAVARTLIDTIKDGSLVFAYYPDQKWLKSSRFLKGCS
jgi:hypothetical protein